MKADDAKRLEELERENTRLKVDRADNELEANALREVAKRYSLSPSSRCRAVVMLYDASAARSGGRAQIAGQHRSTQPRAGASAP